MLAQLNFHLLVQILQIPSTGQSRLSGGCMRELRAVLGGVGDVLISLIFQRLHGFPGFLQQLIPLLFRHCVLRARLLIRDHAALKHLYILLHLLAGFPHLLMLRGFIRKDRGA